MERHCESLREQSRVVNKVIEMVQLSSWSSSSRKWKEKCLEWQQLHSILITETKKDEKKLDCKSDRKKDGKAKGMWMKENKSIALMTLSLRWCILSSLASWLVNILSFVIAKVSYKRKMSIVLLRHAFTWRRNHTRVQKEVTGTTRECLQKRKESQSLYSCLFQDVSCLSSSSGISSGISWSQENASMKSNREMLSDVGWRSRSRETYQVESKVCWRHACPPTKRRKRYPTTIFSECLTEKKKKDHHWSVRW